MIERRRFPRNKCFKGAKLIAPGHARVPCIVRDLSAAGAGLQLLGSADLPDEFELCFETGQRFRQCRMVWRNVTLAGVSFGPRAEAETAEAFHSGDSLRSRRATYG